MMIKKGDEQIWPLECIGGHGTGAAGLEVQITPNNRSAASPWTTISLRLIPLYNTLDGQRIVDIGSAFETL